MNIEEFIKKNIKMLDNNTISIDHLVNKLYVTVLRDQGIERTEELEKSIRDVFVKYKRKEISVDETTKLLNPIVSGDNNSSNNVSETPKTETPKTDTKDASDSNKSESPSPKEEKVEIKKTTVDPAVKQSVKKNLGMLDNNTISVDHLANKMAIEIRNANGVALDDNTKNTLKEVLRSYKKREIGLDDVASYYSSLLSGKKTYVAPKKETKKEEPPEETVVDVDPDQVMNAADKLAQVESNVNDAKVNVPSEIKSYADGIEEEVDTVKEETAKALEDSKMVLVETLGENEAIDSEIADQEIGKMSFIDISKLAYNKKQNSPLVEADESFFKKCGYDVVNNKVTIKKDGVTYVYNLDNKTLSVNGKKPIGVKILVPRNASDYSKLNTYTYFAPKKGTKPPYYADMVYGKNSNAIVLQVIKTELQDIPDPTKGKFIKYEEVSGATRFINAISNSTDNVKNGNCRNIISGDSKYGAYSLMMAAEYPDLYQTVYCVNNAVIVPRDETMTVNGKTIKGNGARGQKTHFDSFEQLKKLNGKEIYFISTGGDDNYTGVKSSYTYTGIKLLSKACPKANIHVVYDNTTGTYRDKISNALDELDSSYKNVHYEKGTFKNYTGVKGSAHTQGQVITADLVSADVTNVNRYTGTIDKNNKRA